MVSLGALIILAIAVSSFASIEWVERLTFEAEGKPIDIVVSYNGRWIYLLTDQGDILIYSADGKMHDKIHVGKSINSISVGPWEEMLFLSDGEEKKVKIISLDFVREIDISGSPFKGPEHAPVVITVFSEFQCPACAALVPTLEQVLEKYPKQVKLVFKNYPIIRGHRFAREAAVAALAAGRQGKFWELHDLLFEHFNQLDREKIKELAQEAGLDMEQFEKDFKDRKFLEAISQDISEGVKLGARGTPTVFVNGRLLKSRSLSGFQAVIDRELENVGVGEVKKVP
jgi:predicted DsbA family dithiol-disulfide isomerase